MGPPMRLASIFHTDLARSLLPVYQEAEEQPCLYTATSMDALPKHAG